MSFDRMTQKSTTPGSLCKDTLDRAQEETAGKAQISKRSEGDPRRTVKNGHAGLPAKADLCLCLHDKHAVLYSGNLVIIVQVPMCNLNV